MGLGLDYAWRTYTADDGTAYSVKVDKAWGENAASALGAPDYDNPVIDAKDCRKAYFQDVAGRRRALIIGTAAAYSAFTGASTVTLPDRGDLDGSAWTWVGGAKEKNIGRKAAPIFNQ
jgi:hypothetical protein